MSKVRIQGLLLAVGLLALAGCERSTPPAAPAPAAPVAAPAPPCVLTMGWDPWEPYHFEDIDGSVRGMEIELAQSIASGAGCTVEFARDSWNTLLQRLNSGDIDMLGGATATEERLDFAHFSAPYRHESFRLYIRVGEGDVYAGANLEDVLANGMRLGVTQSYVYGGEVSELRDHPDYADAFVDHSEAELGFIALTENHVDGVLEDPHVASAILRRRGWQDQIEAHSLDLGSSEVSFMFSRASVDEATIERFNRSLAKLKESGEIEAIIARYRLD